jgi:hypothetical protein
VRAKLDERAARRRDAKQARLHAIFDGWLGQRPELAAALQRADADLRAWQAWDCGQDPASRPHTPLAWDPFLAELTRQLLRREPLSDRQAEFYVRRVAEVASHDEPERQRQALQVPAPEGTVTFAGTVATIRSQPGYIGRVELKMLVIAEAADGGEFRVWCTVPQRGGPCRQGDRITLTAELRRSERDPSFAFGKRPRLGAPARRNAAAAAGACPCRRTSRRVLGRELGQVDGELLTADWQEMHPLACPGEDTARAARELLSHGRAWAAVGLLASSQLGAVDIPSSVTPPLVEEALEAELASDPNTEGPSQSPATRSDSCLTTLRRRIALVAWSEGLWYLAAWQLSGH